MAGFKRREVMVWERSLQIARSALRDLGRYAYALSKQDYSALFFCDTVKREQSHMRE